jgi:hypothetical protein
MIYRDVLYTFHEWKTWNGKQAEGWKCDDKELLKYVDTSSFGTKTQDQMFERIDDYIDNKARHIKMKELNQKACAEFYDKPTNYKGD